MKFKTLLLLFLLFSPIAFSQSISPGEFQDVIKQLQLEKSEIKRPDLLYTAAIYYLEKQGELRKDLDSAQSLNNQSFRLNKRLDFKKSIASNMLLSGRIEAERGNIKLSKKLKDSSLDYAIKNGLKKETADIYLSQLYDLPDEESATKIASFKKVISLYKEAKAKKQEAAVLTSLGELYLNTAQYDLCITTARQAIAFKQKIKLKDIHIDLINLANAYRLKGEYQEALNLALKAEESGESFKDDKHRQTIIYNTLGLIYYDLKLNDFAIVNFNKALAMAKSNNDNSTVTNIARNLVSILYRLRKSKEALKLLNDISNNYATAHNLQDDYIYLMVYCDLKQFDKALPYYNSIMNYYKKGTAMGVDRQMIYQAINMYLLKSGQADKMYHYLDEIRAIARKDHNLLRLSDIEGTYYKADSATANYLSAIQHLKNYKLYQDTVFNLDRSKQLSDMQVKYETEKKDKDIKALKQHGLLQETQLQYEAVMRYAFIAGLIILFLFLGLVYNRYRLKQLSSKRLESKQAKINKQNELLKKLLTEKEWLLKEIHHRVKNNLQIVISLLNTQSSYLENKEALLAIQNSQHRMHAMSLIHQKLYQSNNLVSVDMAWYIYELVNYLKESFDMERKISYKLDTEHLELDVAQAVPLGLILNEAITNAIKYAFPDQQKGKVEISLKNSRDNTYQLIIADNGIGLPEGFEVENRDSLGMNLMVGLSDQLDGSFTIQNNNGLTVIITFVKKEQLMDDEND